MPGSEQDAPVAFIPLWVLPHGLGALAAGFFCMQLGVGGAWGVVSCLVSLPLCLALTRDSQIPIHLAEMSPPAFRATFPGVSYQVGNVRYLPTVFHFRIQIDHLS
jgi:SHS family lactate transporter-like MFS transporter